jgi:hypothetical protein
MVGRRGFDLTGLRLFQSHLRLPDRTGPLHFELPMAPTRPGIEDKFSIPHQHGVDNSVDDIIPVSPAATLSQINSSCSLKTSKFFKRSG